MIKYKRELKNKRDRGVKLKWLKEIIIKFFYKSTQGRSYCNRLSKTHVHLTS